MKIKSIIMMGSVLILGTQMACKHEVSYDVCFQSQVLPIIQSNCAMSGCHDATTAEHDVVLDSYENIMEEVKAGNPSGSKLYEAIVNQFEPMPPSSNKQLTNTQKEIIRSWIVQGAKNDPTCQ